MFKSSSTSLILLGILAVIVGIVAIAWPGVTILALVILFAVYAFMDGGLQGARAFSSRNAGPTFGAPATRADRPGGWHVVALVWPGPTALRPAIIVAAWVLVGGFAEIFAGFQSGVMTAERRARCSSSPGWCPSRSAWCSSRAPASARSPSRSCSAYTAHLRVFADRLAGVQARQVGGDRPVVVAAAAKAARTPSGLRGQVPAPASARYGRPPTSASDREYNPAASPKGGRRPHERRLPARADQPRPPATHCDRRATSARTLPPPHEGGQPAGHDPRPSPSWPLPTCG